MCQDLACSWSLLSNVTYVPITHHQTIVLRESCHQLTASLGGCPGPQSPCGAFLGTSLRISILGKETMEERKKAIYVEVSKPASTHPSWSSECWNPSGPLPAGLGEVPLSSQSEHQWVESGLPWKGFCDRGWCLGLASHGISSLP